MSELEEKTKESIKTGIQVIARSAAILQTLRDYPNGISLGQIAAVGCAFKDRLGALHAISVPIPTLRFDDARKSVEAAFSKTVERLEIMMTDDRSALYNTTRVTQSKTVKVFRKKSCLSVKSDLSDWETWVYPWPAT